MKIVVSYMLASQHSGTKESRIGKDRKTLLARNVTSKMSRTSSPCGQQSESTFYP
jgi:hypothetical protein